MNPFLDWGIPILTAFQNLGDWLRPLMELLTLLGDELGYLAVMPFLLWSVDYGLGLRFGTIVLTSSAVNSMLKWAFGLPRPYWVDTRVNGLLSASSFGFPSGHAQSSMAAWGRLAVWIKKRWAYFAFGVLILLISVSRWYLGVHYPTDTLGGWLTGLILIWAFVRFEKPVLEVLSKRSLAGQILFIFLASLLIIALGYGILAVTQGRTVPNAWAAAALPGSADSGEVFDPRNPSDLFTAAGSLFGLGCGAVLLLSRHKYSAQGSWQKRLGRYSVGLIGMVALYAGLKVIFPSGTDLLALLFRYLRYAVVGLWGTYFAPRLFAALGLSEPLQSVPSA